MEKGTIRARGQVSDPYKTLEYNLVQHNGDSLVGSKDDKNAYAIHIGKSKVNDNVIKKKLEMICTQLKFSKVKVLCAVLRGYFENVMV